MGRRDFGYVAALAGPCWYVLLRKGMSNPDLKNSGNTLWYTSIAITVGPDYWPYRFEGMVLAFMLGLFSFALAGYVIAALAIT